MVLSHVVSCSGLAMPVLWQGDSVGTIERLVLMSGLYAMWSC